MAVKTIGALGLGNMGGAVASALKKNGLDLITALEGRSQATRDSAASRGIEDVGSLDELVRRSDLVLSLLVPAEAPAVASGVAAAMASTGSTPAFADCNAVSPETSKAMGPAIEAAGGVFIDAGIIGGPPSDTYAPRFYASGADTSALAELNAKGIDVIAVGSEAGRASAIKMCYASQTKGITALQTAMLVAAERLGVYDELVAELSGSQRANLERAEGSLKRLPSVAGRWIGEMEEIAATFEQVGVTGHFHKGAAEMFRLVESAGLSGGDDARDTVRAFADAIGE